MKLQKLSDKIDSLEKETFTDPAVTIFDCWNRLLDFKKEIEEPLNIGMFVPAIQLDGKWVVMEKPEGYDEWIDDNRYPGFRDFIACKEYQQAKDKVIFEGFEFVGTALHYYGASNGSRNFYFGKGYVCKHVSFGISYVQSQIIKTIEDIAELGLELTKYGQSKLK